MTMLKNERGWTPPAVTNIKEAEEWIVTLWKWACSDSGTQVTLAEMIDNHEHAIRALWTVILVLAAIIGALGAVIIIHLT